MKVVLLTTSEQLETQEKIAVTATSQCYQTDKLKAAKLPKLAILHGHRTILEFFDLTFLINDISYLTHVHLIRHRHTTPMIQSQRYTEANTVICPFYQDDEAQAFYQGSFDIDDAIKAVGQYTKGRKEQLRYLKPQGASINICLKMNLRAFLEMVEKRTASNVLVETKEIVRQMADIAAQEKVLEPYLRLHTQYLSAHKKMMNELSELAKEN